MQYSHSFQVFTNPSVFLLFPRLPSCVLLLRSWYRRRIFMLVRSGNKTHTLHPFPSFRLSCLVSSLQIIKVQNHLFFFPSIKFVLIFDLVRGYFSFFFLSFPHFVSYAKHRLVRAQHFHEFNSARLLLVLHASTNVSLLPSFPRFPFPAIVHRSSVNVQSSSFHSRKK